MELNTKNILLADGNRDVLEIFQSAFGPPEYEIKVAKTPVDALAQVFSHMPDIIVIDGDPSVAESRDVLKTIRTNSMTNAIPALVILPEDRSEFRKSFDSAGACDFIIKPLTPNKIKMEVESLIRGRNLFGSRMSSKIITFCGSRGGSGVTTMAINTAIAIHELGKSVILLEHANYFSGIRPALNINSRKTVPFLISEQNKELTPERVKEYLSEHASGIKTIATIAGISDMEKMDADAIRFMRFNLCPIAEYAVIDAGYGLNEAALELFDISDRVIFVSTCDLISLYNLEMITQVFEGTRINLDKCSVIFNHIHSQGEIAESAIKGLKLNLPIMGFIPNNSVGFLKAINNGQPYLTMFPKTPQAKAIRTLGEKILEITSSVEVKAGVA